MHQTSSDTHNAALDTQSAPQHLDAGAIQLAGIVCTVLGSVIFAAVASRHYLYGKLAAAAQDDASKQDLCVDEHAAATLIPMVNVDAGEEEDGRDDDDDEMEDDNEHEL